MDRENSNTYIMQIKAHKYFELLDKSENKQVNLDNFKNEYTGCVPDSLELRYLNKYYGKDFFAHKSKKGLSSIRTNLVIDVSFKEDYKETVAKESYYKKSKNVGYDIKLENGYGKIIKSRLELRRIFYIKGFDLLVNGKIVHYVFYNRGSNKVKDGHCLFIQQKAFDKINKWALMDLTFDSESKDVKKVFDFNNTKKYKIKGLNKAKHWKIYYKNRGESCDATSLFAYRALTTSGIIDTLNIKPHEILLIDDFVSEFTAKASVTEYDSKSKKLTVQERDEPQTSDIFDGQSLMDSSMFGVAPDNNTFWVNGKYHNKGMLLLRNKFFKSCAFNCNIQQWFKDKGITEISQLNGITTSENISDIKLIITPNSLKALKFKYKLKSEECNEPTIKDMFLYWLEHTDNEFGIVKYEKPSQFWRNKDGQVMNQLSYQMINTLDLSREDVDEILTYSKNRIMDMKNNYSTFRKYLDHNKHQDCTFLALSSIANVNSGVRHTQMYCSKKAKIVESLRDNLLKGHVIVPSDNCTMVSNPIEMLKNACGIPWEDSLHKPYEIYTPLYDDGMELTGFRSPHICSGNVCVFTNKRNDCFLQYKFVANTNIFM